MVTIYDIKKQADELSAKTNINSIPPSEVGGLIRDLADYAGNIEINGGSLGIRKVYASIVAMEADTAPVGLDGNPLKRGNLVAIYDGTDTGADNNKIYSYQKPGWVLTSKMDAAYATRDELNELQNENKHYIRFDILLSIEEYNSIIKPDPRTLYIVIESGLITHVFLGKYSFPVAGGSEITKENFPYELPLTLG